MQTVNILGATYSIEYKTIAEDNTLEGIDGYCDYTDRKIVIKSENNNNLGDFERLKRKNLRHEIIHAFLSESGLQANFQHCEKFGHDETMVDWFAIQFPRIAEVYKKLDIAE